MPLFVISTLWDKEKMDVFITWSMFSRMKSLLRGADQKLKLEHPGSALNPMLKVLREQSGKNIFIP